MGSELDSAFEECRKILVDRFEGDRKAAWKALSGNPEMTMVRGTFNKLFDSTKGPKDFRDYIKRQVTSYIAHDDDARFYYACSARMGIGDEDISHLKNYIGDYVYLRKTANGDIAKGSLKIEGKDGVYKFAQKSCDADENESKHEGFVFFIHDRVHLVGIGDRYFRPVVFRHVDSVEKHYLLGYITSISSVDLGSIVFSSMVLLLNYNHELVVESKTNETALIDKFNELLDKYEGEAGLLTLTPTKRK